MPSIGSSDAQNRDLVTMRDQARKEMWLLGAAVAWAAIVYWPILGNYFLGDDFGNLFFVVNRPLAEYVFEPTPGHLPYVQRLLFYLFYHAFGPDPRWFFASMLLNHLVNVALLFGIVRALTGNAVVACLGAALWGSARINEGTLGWYCVYGQVLASTLLLVLLGRLIRARQRGVLHLREAMGWYAILLLACVCFGSAIPVAVVFPAVTWLLLPAEVTSRRVRLLILSLPVTVVVGYAAAYELYVAAYGGSSKEHAWLILQFGLGFITQSALMTVHLFRAGLTALVSGVTAMPSYTSLRSYVTPGLIAAALGVTWGRSPTTVRRWLTALLLMTLAIYATIAVGRAFLFYKDPAEGGWTSRYHYMPTLLLTVMLCLMLARAATALRRPQASATVLLVVWLGGMGLAWARGGWIIDQHRNMRALTERTLATIRGAIEAKPGTGPVFLQNAPFQPLMFNPYDMGGWAGLFSVYRPDVGRRLVYFIELRPEVRARAPKGSPMAALLYPPA